MDKQAQQRDRKPQYAFEANQDLLDELREVSDRTGIPASVIAREGVWAKLAELRKTHPVFDLDRQTVSA
jgi:hypothetical protein